MYACVAYISILHSERNGIMVISNVMNMEQHVNTLLSVYGEDLNRLRNRVGKDRSEHTFRDNFEKQLQDLSSLF